MSDDHDRAELRELAKKLTWRGAEPTEGRFLSVFMDQNNKCNLRCRMCGFSDARVAALQKYDMPRWLFDRIAAEVFPRASYVCLSLMTEPFMTRDFPDRLAAVRRYAVPFSEVITNGTLLTRETCGKIVDAGLARVIISIDGGTKEVFESIRVGARFERVVGAVELLRGVRDERGAALPAIRINHVLSELNVDHFGEFLELMALLRPEEIAVRTISRMSEAELQESSDPRFWAKVRQARVALAELCAATGMRDSAYLRARPTLIDLFTDAGEHLICRKPWDTLAIHPNGDVYPCMAWSRPPVGNLATETFEDVWNGAALQALRHEFTRDEPGLDCLNCTIRRDLNGDPDDDFFYRKLARQPVFETLRRPASLSP